METMPHNRKYQLSLITKDLIEALNIGINVTDPKFQEAYNNAKSLCESQKERELLDSKLKFNTEEA